VPALTRDPALTAEEQPTALQHGSAVYPPCQLLYCRDMAHANLCEKSSLCFLQFFANYSFKLAFGLVMIGPWAILVIYDLILYVFRAVTYEIPVIGGRARGKARPRAPSLTERPNGHRRNFSLARSKEDTGNSTGSGTVDAPEARSRRSNGEAYNGSGT
jgi:hypothetical protein